MLRKTQLYGISSSGQLILRKILKNLATIIMSHFKAEMHQIRFRLRLRPRPRWGRSQRFPRPPSWIKGVLLLKGGEGMGRKERRRGGRGRGGKGREKMDGTSPAWSSPDLGSTEIGNYYPDLETSLCTNFHLSKTSSVIYHTQ